MLKQTLLFFFIITTTFLSVGQAFDYQSCLMDQFSSARDNSCNFTQEIVGQISSADSSCSQEWLSEHSFTSKAEDLQSFMSEVQKARDEGIVKIQASLQEEMKKCKIPGTISVTEGGQHISIKSLTIE